MECTCCGIPDCATCGPETCPVHRTPPQQELVTVAPKRKGSAMRQFLDLGR